MFCPNCGKELLDGAKFCPLCGNAVPASDSGFTAQESNDGATSSPSPEISQTTESANGHPQKTLFRPRNIIVLIATVCLISIVILFAVRASNEGTLRETAADTLYLVFEYEISSHYDPLMSKPKYENGYEVNYDKSAFKLQKVSDMPNSFIVTGNFIVKDLISEGNPEYVVSVKSDVNSDFMRKLCACINWTIEYEDPEFIGPSADIDIYLFDFLGTYASISDSADTLEMDLAAYKVFLTGFSNNTTAFGTQIFYDIDVEFNPRSNREDCSNEFGSMIFTFVPANYSQFGADTIYMESENLQDTVYVRTGYEYTDFSEFGYDYLNPYVYDNGPTMFVDMKELENAFSSNAFSAESIYGGQCIAVTGTIDSITTSGSTATVRLGLDYVNIYSAEYHWFEAYFEFEEENTYSLYGISSGQTITIAGYLDKVWSSSWIEFKDCYIY